MRKKFLNSYSIKEGTSAAVPIVIGYIPIAVTFGIMAKSTDISLIDCFLFSAIVFAGASQFMALNLISLGVSSGEIILTTLLVNFRHFLMSASLATKLPKDAKKWIPFIAFWVTDETFSVVSFKDEKISKGFMISLQISTYLSWVGGSVLGYLAGGILPQDIRTSMGVGLYTMFIALLVPQAKKSAEIMILACMSGIVNSILIYSKMLPNGWSIILSICLVSFLGLYIFKEESVKAYEQ